MYTQTYTHLEAFYVIMQFNVGTYTISMKYLFKRGNRNTYYYRRRVPKELAQHYPKPFIEISLKQSDRTVAAAVSQETHQMVEEQFERLRQGLPKNKILTNYQSALELLARHNLPDDHPEQRQMELINDFLRGHTWACKGPVRLTYNTSVVGGGRLVTPYQSLPDRRIRLRIRTLIDEQPICEVDYNANHLRLNLALLHNQHAGDTPYEDICDIAGFEYSRRTQVKAFVTRASKARL